MAAKTSIKVATITSAAQNEQFGFDEDVLAKGVNFNVLDGQWGNPGSATLYSIAQVSGTSTTTQFPVENTAHSALGGTISVNANGTIHYDASTLKIDLQALAEGETRTDTFTYTIRMANGALSTGTVTVTITGDNDPPTLDAVTPATPIHDTAAYDTPAAIEGQLVGHDVDHNAVLTYGFAAGVAATSDGDKLVATTDYGTVTLDTKTGEYKFDVDAAKLNGLHAGDNPTISLDVVVTDEHGATSGAQTLSFDLIGANDTATIDGKNGDVVTEDGTKEVSGTLSVSDADTGEAKFASVDASNLHGTYGDFTFDTDTGEWTYTLRNDDANVQALTAADQVSDKLTVSSLDGTAAETIEVVVKGADEPVVIPPPPPPPAAPTVQEYSLPAQTTDYDTRWTDGSGRFAINSYTGGNGNDLIDGGSAADTLNGGAGNDTIYGGDAADRITGGQGFDYLYGQGASDTFFYTNANEATDVIQDFQVGVDKLDFSGAITSGGASYQIIPVDTTGDHQADSSLVQVDSNGSATGGTLTDMVVVVGVNLTSDDIAWHA